MSSSVIVFMIIRPPPRSTLFPYRRSSDLDAEHRPGAAPPERRYAQQEDRRHGRPRGAAGEGEGGAGGSEDRKSTRLNSSHRCISYAVFCLKKKKKTKHHLSHLPPPYEFHA